MRGKNVSKEKLQNFSTILKCYHKLKIKRKCIENNKIKIKE